MNAALSTYIRLLQSLHRLIATDQGDSPEADAVRDEMDGPWRQLSSSEIALVDGLSEDLYSLSEAHADPSEGIVPLQPAEIVQAAFKAQDWPRVLELVRDNSAGRPFREVALIRGMCWANLGQPDVAIEFFEAAHKIAPLSAVDEVWLLTAYVSAGRAREAIPRAREIGRSSSEPALLFTASHVLFAATSEELGESSFALHREAIDIALRGRELVACRDSSELLDMMQVSALTRMALSHDALGERDAALHACMAALQIDPHRSVALEVLGYLCFNEYPARQRAQFRNRVDRLLSALPQRVSVN